MAAGQAASLGKNTLLIEKMKTPGRKLLLTGKNRCNLTNTASVPDALEHFNEGGRFLTQLFYRYYANDLRQFFTDLRLPTVEQRGGRVFPKSEKAQDVLETLLSWIRSSGVEMVTDTAVSELQIQGGKISRVVTQLNTYQAPAVILATGGKSYPGTGSTGDGFAFARRSGHKIIPLRPALVPIITSGDTAQKLQGLSLKNVSASVWVNNKKLTQMFGEMMFTHFGLSGPVILSLSRQIVNYLQGKNHVEIKVDLKPALDHTALETRLLRDIQTQGRKQFSSMLEGLLPKKMILICSEQIGVPLDKKLSQISGEERKKLRHWLKEDFKFSISGHKGFEHAIITAGGVDTSEVNPETMESKIIQGLYFGGEILDVDADTGGYNLQAAFSTGWAAGKAAAR
ncbi:MAG: NAD(P)/FAD-dependent oxidoreductase [Anaerolineales bacterium]|nr:NAD(P)/FAD-dependent oxidoreductase [Anaerolineales bacterium]